MGRVLNFWNESEAIDTFFHIVQKDEPTFEDFEEYLEEWAPWLLKHKHRIWLEINS